MSKRRSRSSFKVIFRRHVAWVLALASLGVASLSLYYSLVSQRFDFDHKELLIRPSLAYEMIPENFHIGIINRGLGPAEVKRVWAYFDGACIDSAKSSDWFETSEALHVVVDNYFQLRHWPPASKNVRLILFSRLPRVGDIIESNKGYPIFEVGPPTFLSEFNKLGIHLQEAVDNFRERAISVPLAVKFCSLTGKYCATLLNIRKQGSACISDD